LVVEPPEQLPPEPLLWLEQPAQLGLSQQPAVQQDALPVEAAQAAQPASAGLPSRRRRAWKCAKDQTLA